MNIPDFLIVGGMKCGSSSLRNYLMQHPKVTMLPAEGNFFNMGHTDTLDLRHYRDRFLKLDPHQRTLWGEKTVDYSYFPDIPKKIHQANPDVKLIWIFRDPIKRTYSNYWHEYKRGEEWLTFKQAIYEEDIRKITNPIHAYKEKSLYSHHVKRFLEYFSIDQMHFILFEEMIKQHHSVFVEVLRFLGADSWLNLDYQPVNATVLPRFPTFFRCGKKIVGTRGYFYKLLYVLNFKGKKPGFHPIAPHENEYLKSYFEPFNKELAQITGLDLSVWK